MVGLIGGQKKMSKINSPAAILEPSPPSKIAVLANEKTSQCPLSLLLCRPQGGRFSPARPGGRGEFALGKN